MPRQVEKEQAEVKKLHHKIYERTKSSTLKFKREFKKQIVVGVTAAFAFLIALSWREPIKNSVDSLISKMRLAGKAVYIEYLSAIVITLIAVLALILISKWASREE